MIKNIVFDVGQVLMSYTPEKLSEETLDFQKKQYRLCVRRSLKCTLWEAGDRGIISTEEIWEGFRKNATGIKKRSADGI